MYAVREGQKEMVQLLLEHKAEVEAKDQSGYKGPKEGGQGRLGGRGQKQKGHRLMRVAKPYR